jgi:hypothetical protein
MSDARSIRCAFNNLSRMAEAASTESVPARLAEIRDQLKLLADYL